MLEKRSGVWALLILVIAGAGLTFWLLGFGVADPEDSSNSESQKEHEAGDVDPDPAPVGGQESPKLITKPFEEAAPATKAGSNADPQRLKIRVILDNAQGPPAAGAKVEIVDLWSAAHRAFENSRGLLHDESIAFRRFGLQYLADVKGELHLPMPEAGVSVRASYQGRHASDIYDAEDERVLDHQEIVLVLKEYLPIRVQVLDANASPVGQIGVQLLREFSGRSSHMMGSVTDDNGLAFFPHALVTDGAKDASLYSVALGVGLWEQGFPRRQLERSDFGGAPVVLRLPKTSSCRVNVLGDDGLPFEGEALAFLMAFVPDRRGTKRFLRLRNVLPAQVTNGVAELPHLQPGREYRVLVKPAIYPIQGRAQFRAPEAGASSSVSVQLTPRLTGLHIHLTDSEGEEITAPRISCTVRGISEAPDNFECDVGAGGRIFVEVDPSQREGSGPMSLEIIETIGDSDLPRRGMLISSACPAVGQTLDLGQQSLRPPKVLAQGTAEFANGKPCGGAKVTLMTPIQTPDGEELSELGEQIADKSGHWSYLGFYAPANLVAQASAPSGYAGPEVRFEHGAHNVRLTVGHQASLKGSLKLAPKASHLGFSLVLECKRQSGRTTSHHSPLPAAEPGVFNYEFLYLHPGSYTLTIATRFDGEIVHQTQPFDIKDGDHKRLDFDSAQKLHTFRLELKDESGHGVFGARVACADSGVNGVAGGSLVSDAKGEVLIQSTQDRHLITIQAKGFHSLERIPISGPETLVMTRIARLTLRSKSLSKLDPSVSIAFQVKVEGSRHSGGEQARTQFAQFTQGQCQVQRPHGSSISVSVTLSRPGSAGHTRLPKSILSLPAEPGPLELDVEWEADVIENAISLLKG